MIIILKYAKYSWMVRYLVAAERGDGDGVTPVELWHVVGIAAVYH